MLTSVIPEASGLGLVKTLLPWAGVCGLTPGGAELALPTSPSRPSRARGLLLLRLEGFPTGCCELGFARGAKRSVPGFDPREEERRPLGGEGGSPHPCLPFLLQSLRCVCGVPTTPAVPIEALPPGSSQGRLPGPLPPAAELIPAL